MSCRNNEKNLELSVDDISATTRIQDYRGSWLAQLVKCATLDLRVMRSSPKLDVEPT